MVKQCEVLFVASDQDLALIAQMIKQKLEPDAQLMKSQLAKLAAALGPWTASYVLHHAEIICDHYRLQPRESDRLDAPESNQSIFQ